MGFGEFVDAALNQNSFADTIDLSEMTQVEDGQYYAINDDGKYPFDVEKAFRRYNYMITEKIDNENYDGTGLANYYAEFFYDEKLQHYDSVVQLSDGKWYSILTNIEDYEIWRGRDATEYIDEISKAVSVLNESGATEISDAYGINWSMRITYSSGSELSARSFGCDAVYFNTDKGEFVVTYNIDQRLADKWEEYMLYPVDEFLKVTADVHAAAKPVVKEKVLTEDENGDEKAETIVEVPVHTSVSDDEPAEEPKQSPEPTEEPEENREEEPEKSPEPTEEPEKDSEEKGFVKTDMNKIDVLLNGKTLEFADQEPIIVKDRVLVPLRVIFEELGANVGWDGETHTVTMEKNGTVVSLKIGAAELIKDGTAVDLDVAAQIQNERTLVPIRAITESFGNTVTWDGNNKIVEIK